MLMKKLYLLRHAKSDWSHDHLDDKHRPLNKRGTNAATIMGKYCAEKQIDPQLILCSGATRTRLTLKGLEENAHFTGAVIFRDDLYLCGAPYLAQEISKTSEDNQSLMVIGHSPDLQQLALHLTQDDTLRQKYPTACLTEIEILSSWKDILSTRHNLLEFMPPRSMPSY